MCSDVLAKLQRVLFEDMLFPCRSIRVRVGLSCDALDFEACAASGRAPGMPSGSKGVSD